MLTAELLMRLRAVAPDVVLVKDRSYRQILRRLAEQGEPVPPSVEAAVRLRRDVVSALKILPDSVLPVTPELLLIHSPEDWLAESLSDSQVLRYYWRHLFRDRLQVHLASTLQALTPTTTYEDAHFVLVHDGLVAESSTLTATLPAIVAAWYELKFFEPDQLPFYFPSLSDSIVPLVDASTLDSLLSATRPAGAAALEDRVQHDWHAEVPPDEPSTPEAFPIEAIRDAEEAKSRGNWVRVAILHRRKGDLEASRAAIENGLIPRLAALLNWSARQQQQWAVQLWDLVEPASRGFWPRAARCLYDLQKIVTDLRGELSTVDPIAWVRTFGRTPIVRKLTRARGVILLRHLRTAEKHLVRSQLPPETRERIERLLESEMAAWEQRLREELSPVIGEVLNQVGLRPRTAIERVAQDKIVAELLDLICTKGYIRMADLRDAIARNQLKLQNLTLGQFLRGDAILQADKLLAQELDGVYQGGEIYLRWLQRGTGLTFGTPLGRWLSKYVALPFGGAFMAVEFTKYVKYELVKLSGFVLKQLGLGQLTVEDHLGVVGGSLASGHWHAETHHGTPFSLASLGVVFVLGSFLLLVLYVPEFRQRIVQGLSALWRLTRLAVVGLPAAVWSSAPVRWLRHNEFVRWVHRYCGTALWVTLFVGLLLTLYFGDPEITTWSCTAVFVSITLFSMTPTGRLLEDELADRLAAMWRDLSITLVQNILSWFLWVFQVVGNVIERWLYTVDEWLRFREGQSLGSLWLKAIFAVIWFPIAYLFRFSFYLLIEPQVNPVKHFPVVTVGHKLILPLTPELANLLGSTWIAGGIVSGVPGVFGFIAWELKENWRLYAANRSDHLPWVVLGHHGETLRGLLKPGFHSGTVPKLLAKMRRMLHAADRTGLPQPVGKVVHAQQEIEHALHLFVEREWLATLKLARELQPKPWKSRHPSLGNHYVILGVELQDKAYVIRFEHWISEIRSSILSDDLLGELTPDQAEIFQLTVAGVQAMACVEGTGLSWPQWEASWERYFNHSGKNPEVSPEVMPS